MNRPGRYDSAQDKESIIHEFELYRVLIDIEDFMKHVLHIPDDWKIQWEPMIKKIKTNNRFRFHRQLYHGGIERNSSYAREHAFRGPFMDLGNTILDIASEFPLETAGPKATQRTNPSPGVTAPHKNSPSHLQSSESTLVDELCVPGLKTDGGFVKTVEVM